MAGGGAGTRDVLRACRCWRKTPEGRTSVHSCVSRGHVLGGGGDGRLCEVLPAFVEAAHVEMAAPGQSVTATAALLSPAGLHPPPSGGSDPYPPVSSSGVTVFFVELASRSHSEVNLGLTSLKHLSFIPLIALVPDL